MSESLHVTRLLVWEFRQSVRFQAFRHSKNRQVGYPLDESEHIIAKLTEHLESGSVKMVNCDMVNILVIGERISKRRTFAGGHRSFDILHVATAVNLDARDFLSFDAIQNDLAAAEGLKTPLSGG